MSPQIEMKKIVYACTYAILHGGLLVLSSLGPHTYRSLSNDASSKPAL